MGWIMLELNPVAVIGITSLSCTFAYTRHRCSLAVFQATFALLPKLIHCTTESCCETIDFFVAARYIERCS